ncbi:MAG: hypothetical protein QM598_06230 [Protaetiibacter sp.]
MSGLVIPPPAAREMHASHERPPLSPGTRIDTVWVWLIVSVPWVLASTIFLFDIDVVFDALWVGDTDAALAHVALHLGLLVASSLLTIALALLFASRDARRLRAVGVVRPFPWGFAAIAGLVYLIGRQVVLGKVTRAPIAPLAVSIALYVLWYTAFGVWAAVTVTNGLAGLGAAG